MKFDFLKACSVCSLLLMLNFYGCKKGDGETHQQQVQVQSLPRQPRQQLLP